MNKRMVVATTDKDRRGVFFGEYVSGDTKTGIVKLKNAKMCVYWSPATKGVLGLASIGPQNGSKLTPTIKEIEINGVTSIMDCDDVAVQQWEKELWG